MRFPWTRNREAREAREKAEAHLDAIRARRPAVDRHAAAAEEHIRVNHIAQKVYELLDGRR